MTKPDFTLNEIRNGLIKMSKKALRTSGKQLRRQAQKGRRLESRFEKAVLDQTPPGWEKVKRVRRSSLKAITKSPRDDGWIDVLFKYKERYKLLVEFKVVQLPRLKNTSPENSLHDIVEIAWDYLDLKCKYVDASYCLIVLDGALVETDNATSKNVARHFHNAMFVDFQTVCQFGKRRIPHWKLMRETIAEMGFDRPYGSGAKSKDFCYLDKNIKFAAIGICVQ